MDMCNATKPRRHTLEDNELTVVVEGMANDSVLLSIKIGILKDLFEQKLITSQQLEQALQLLNRKGK
jgi:hypothetical protein